MFTDLRTVDGIGYVLSVGGTYSDCVVVVVKAEIMVGAGQVVDSMFNIQTIKFFSFVRLSILKGSSR